MRIPVLALTAGITLIPLLAFAQDSAPPTQPVSTTTTTAENPSPDQIVCHYYYSHGTIVGHADCRPLHYWTRRRHELQEDIREFQLRSLSEKG
jgi:hypothetical protein